MNIQKRKRIFKGATLSLVLCVVVLSMMAPAAFAATITNVYAEVVSSYINVRSGPGLSYDIVCVYHQGTQFYANEGDYIEADGYKWYVCPDGFIAQTGGLKFYDYTEYQDTICAYDPYGEKRWEHACCGTDNPNWGYNISVDEGGYLVSCDCGWSNYYYVSHFISVGDPSGDGYYELVFVGLDTDGDEQIDLRPGQNRRLVNRANSDLRSYQILEFLDDPNKDCPTVTLCFRNRNNLLLFHYTFNWSVTLYVESYGIVMVGNDGMKTIHYVEDDFLLYDDHIGVFLADTPHEYVANKAYGTEKVSIAEKHQYFDFTLAPPGEGQWGGLEHVVDGIRDVFSDIGGFFSDFGGLGSVFTDEDSPIYKLTHGGFGEGVQNVFSLVRSFVSALPEPLLAVIGSIFIISCLLGVIKLFRG